MLFEFPVNTEMCILFLLSHSVWLFSRVGREGGGSIVEPGLDDVVLVVGMHILGVI